MKPEITDQMALEILIRQISSFWPISDNEKSILTQVLPEVRENLYSNFMLINNKYYKEISMENVINSNNSSQYTNFLYKLSRSIGQNFACRELADKIYYLNKIMNSVDLYHEVDLPNIFFCDHPLASVMGRASYADFFSFSQGCTVGNNKGIYPVIENHVLMCSNSSIIGHCNIGEYCIISSNCIVKDQDIPSYSLAFGQSPDVVIKSISKRNINKYFTDIWK